MSNAAVESQMGHVVMGDVQHTKKARRKQWKRKQRAQRATGGDPNEYTKPLNQQLWYRELLKVTEFDVVRALRDWSPTEGLGVPDLDSWGTLAFLIMIFQFFTGVYARTLDKPYTLPKAPLGQTYGPDVQPQASGASIYNGYSVDDLFGLLTKTRYDARAPFESSEAGPPKTRLARSQKRVKRSDGLYQYRHHRGHRRRHQRRHAKQPPNPLQDAIVYPEDKLSDWIKNVFNSVESVVSLLGPALRDIGFEPDEMVEVERDISGLQHMGIRSKNITAAEFVVYLTTDGHEKYRLNPLTDRARELENIITEKGRYGKNNFLSKEVLKPIKSKHRAEAISAIGKKFEDIDRIFLERMATLYYVKAETRPKIGLSGVFVASVKGELGTIVKIPGPEATRYFAIVPHHPDMVIQVPDPNSGEKWQRWMATTGKHLFFSDPSTLPKRSLFSVKEEDPGNFEHPDANLRRAILHTIKPIIDGAVNHMTELVSHEAPAERAFHKIMSLVPFYDFSKSVVEGKIKKAVVFLSFDMIPYVGKGARIFFKTTFTGASTRLVDKVAKLTDNGFNVFSKVKSGDVANTLAEDSGRTE